MAETYTIKPDGGGDYTVLQTAENAQDGDLTGRGVVTFECYTGTGGVGGCTIESWTNADSSNYVRVFVPLAERHNGDKTAGAYADEAININIGNDFTRVEGMRVSGSSSYSFQGLAGNNGLTNLLFDSCLSSDPTTIGFNGMLQALVGAGESSTFRNCISIDAGTIGFQLGGAAMINGTVTNYVYNCLAYGSGSHGFELHNDFIVAGGGGNVTLENCISMENTGDDFNVATDTGAGTLTLNYDLSSDATADDFGGSDHLVSQTDTDVFVDPANDDYTLKVDSPARHAGKDLSGSFTNDAAHLESEAWRPQLSDFDMGPLERSAGKTSYALSTSTAL